MDSHEPMMLGSPVSHTSPSPTLAFQQHQSGQFLPGFLIGDPSHNKTPVFNRSLNAPGSSHSYHLHSPTFANNAAKNSPPSVTLSPGNKFGQMMRSRVNATSAMASKEKAGAPPVSSLVDDDNQSFPSPYSNTSMTSRTGVTDIFGRPGSASRMESHTPKSHRVPQPPRTILANGQDLQSIKTSPAQLDPFYSQGEALTSKVELDDTWVTVFGFPPTASSYILQQFSKCGVILEHCSAPDEGNWINIRFESKLQARKALSKSSKILPGNLMIGVTPCIDLKVMNRNKECDSMQENVHPELVLTPSTPGLHPNTSRLNTSKSALNSPKPCTIRPLTAAYNAASSGNKVASDVRTPQKSSGVLTKAMDYIFG